MRETTHLLGNHPLIYLSLIHISSLPSRAVSYVTTQELEELYPTQPPKERESLYVKEHPTAFIMQIGDKLKSGSRHDGRAPDYDDWKLNGDLVFWNEVLGLSLIHI